MTELLQDGHGRRIEYLRISVTDRCDLRCAYCMPPGGLELSPRCDILQYKELLRLIGIFAKLGVRKVRLTGGEPLMRKGILGFIKQVKEIQGIDRIAMTTNGTQLKRMAKLLREAGVAGLNISLDTLNRDKYRSITGYDELDCVLKGLDAAITADFESVKVNFVVMKGINENEIESFVDLAKQKNIQVRFLEFMPATPSVWSENKFVPIVEVKKRVTDLTGGDLVALEKAKYGGPAEVLKFRHSPGQIGFIAAVTHHFCAECNRLRLTSSGELISCLFSSDSFDLKPMLRSNRTDNQIADTIKKAVRSKNAVRELPDDSGADQPRRLDMPAIGG